MTTRVVLVFALLLGASTIPAAAAEKQAISPPDVKPVGPYSPGIMVGEFLYVSGQGAKRPDGSIPDTLAGQIHQSLENVKSVVQAAGLTLDHLVFTQVYLTESTNEDELNRVWREVFSKNPPARSTIGVARLPGTPVEVAAIAVKDLSRKKRIAPPGYPESSPIAPGIMVGGRLYLSGFLGRDINTGKIPDDPAAQVELSLDRMRQTLVAAGMDYSNLVFVNPYLTTRIPMNIMNRIYASHFEFGNTPARATIEVASLPNGANIEFSGVAVRDLSQRRAVRPKNMEPSPTASPCVFAGDTLYCSAKSGFIPGPRSGIYASSVEEQVRQTMRNLLDGLEEAGMNLSDVVASNVYLNDMNDFARMNAVYAEYFPNTPPARTTVQQIPAREPKADKRGRWPTLEQISIVAVK
ncbi:MAG TPA: RidA family protein [Bryobacteraceae bacterium]|nr:RidA family protein [Bryobacteraceae bacterium]